MEKGQNEGFKIKNPNWQPPKEPFSFNFNQEKNIPNVYDACLKFDKKNKLVQDEISNLKMELEKANFELIHDPLTGCYNKQFFENFKKENFDPINDHNNLALVFFDLNNLKLTNDEFGHEAGDRLIKKNANYLQENFKGDDYYIIRLGGDEFLAICKNSKKDQKFEEKLTIKVDQMSLFYPKNTQYPEHDLGFSFGLAIYDRNKHQNLDDTKHEADISMYKNKKDQKQQLSQEV